MKKYTSDTKQPLVDNEHQTFLFGAPFSCYKYGDNWNEEAGKVNGITSKLQAPVWDEDLQKWTTISLLELNFTTTPMSAIKAGIEAIEEDSRTELELILLERMEGLSEDELEMSVASYCDEVLTAPFFDSVDV